MKFKRFVDFLKERGVSEDVAHAKEPSMEYDTKMLTLHNRFPGMSIDDIEKIIKSAGYGNIPAFLHDKDGRKWNHLQIPGQKNYVKPFDKPHESE